MNVSEARAAAAELGPAEGAMRDFSLAARPPTEDELVGLWREVVEETRAASARGASERDLRRLVALRRWAAGEILRLTKD